MNDETPQPPNLPDMLDYQPPQPARNGPAIGQFVIGFILSTTGVAAVSAAIILNSYPIGGPPPAVPPPRPILPPILYVGLGIAAFAATAIVWRKRPAGRWFVLGLLIGVGVTALLEGACFAAK